MSIIAAQHAVRAIKLQNNLGTRCAAGFLRNRDVSFEEALFILLGTKPR